MLVGPVLGPIVAGWAAGPAGAWPKTVGTAKKPMRAMDAIGIRKCTCQHSLLGDLRAVEFNLNGLCGKHSIVFHVSNADLVSRHTVSCAILTIQEFRVNSDLAVLFRKLDFQFNFFRTAFDQDYCDIALFQFLQDPIEFCPARCLVIVYFENSVLGLNACVHSDPT